MEKLEIDQDLVLSKMQGFNQEDGERASDAGKSRQEIGEFLQETGINNKAFSQCRTVLKMKKDTQRQDWLRSMRALMPLMEEQIASSGTRDAFDVPAGAKAAANTPDDGAGDDGPDDDDAFPEDAPAGDPEIAAEADAFEKDVAQYEGNVKPFAAKKTRARKAMAAE